MKFLLNDSAQMNLIEVIIVAGMLLMALYFVSSMEFSSYSSIENENQLEVLGKGILKNLEDQPAPDGSSYDTLLSSYLKNEDQGYAKLRTYILSMLPEGTLYNVTLVNMSKFFYNSSASLSDCNELTIRSAYWIGEDARASRIVVIDGYVYEIILSMWLNIGGV